MDGVPESHRAKALKGVGFFLLTVSTSRFEKEKAGQEVEDPSADLAAKLIEEAGHQVVARQLVPDDSALIVEKVNHFLSDPLLDVLVTMGGTGVSKDDVTVEVLKPHIEKELEGFGELFRYLSYKKVGAPAYLSRSAAGTVRDKLVYCLPGSPDAVELALRELIIPEAGHALYLLRSRKEKGS